jgi:hypothetical protein
MPTEGLAPIHPEEFGAELRRAREQAELSLADIMAQTKISHASLKSRKGTFCLPERFCRISSANAPRRSVSIRCKWLVDVAQSTIGSRQSSPRW